MNKAEFIKGLDQVIAGLEDMKVALAESEKETGKEAVASTKKTEKVAKEPVKEEKTVEGKFSKADLDAMKYNDLKKLGAEMGVKCTGTRDEITEKILAVTVTASKEDDSEEEEKDSKVVSIDKGKKKLGKKEAEPEKEPEPEEDEGDEFDAQAKAVAEEESAEDIIASLAKVKVKATKKNYVEKLAEALRKGLIELGSDEEEEEGSDSDNEEVGYAPEYDPDGYNDPDNMSDARAEAVASLVAEVMKAIEDEEIGEEDIINYLNEVCTEDELELIGEDYEEEQLVAFYLEIRKRFVDDEGVEHEPSDPYELGEENFCCGHQLAYSKKNKKYICSTCGEEYEAE